MPDEPRLVFLCELTLDTTSLQASGVTLHGKRSSYRRPEERSQVRL